MVVGPTGLYDLYRDNEGGRYEGPHAEEKVLIVARGTEQERLFTKAQMAEAARYVRETRRALVSVRAKDIPAAAVERLFSV